MRTAAAIYLIIVVAMSLASFLVYGLDKGRAATGGRRIPERTLHLIAFLGGWPGALLGQQQYRHKTKKVSFRIVFWIAVVYRAHRHRGRRGLCHLLRNSCLICIIVNFLC